MKRINKLAACSTVRAHSATAGLALNLQRRSGGGRRGKLQLTWAGGEMSDMFALSLGQTGLKPSLDLLAKKKAPIAASRS